MDLWWNLVFTAILALAVVVGTHFGITGVAIAVMLTHLLLQPLYVLWARRVVLVQPAVWIG